MSDTKNGILESTTWAVRGLEMLYLFTPIDEHFDKGFGAVADSFHEAADGLLDKGTDKSILNGHLAISFLYRHAIELYLKGSIIIMHKHIRIPYGECSYNGEPYVRVGKKWKYMYHIHSVNDLYKYLMALFEEQKTYLNENTRTDWNFPESLVLNIKKIQSIDNNSTYFRYPITKNQSLDKEKSSFKSTTTDTVMERAQQEGKPMKTMMIIDMLDQVRSVCIHDDESSQKTVSLLRDTSEVLSGCHAALMGDLVGNSL